jgi:hypothetical protein
MLIDIISLFEVGKPTKREFQALYSRILRQTVLYLASHLLQYLTSYCGFFLDYLELKLIQSSLKIRIGSIA